MDREQDNSEWSYRDRMAIEEHERLSPRLIYQIIRRDGIEELRRPTRALVYSGIAAGLVITFSFIFKAVFMAYTPNVPWAPLIDNIGYTVGFLLVILGRLQLFTENTITTVVPMFNPLTLKKMLAVARMWGVVLGSNLIGTTLAAAFLHNGQVFNPEFVQAMDQIARHVYQMSVAQNIWRGIPAGILIASVVWMMPVAGNNKFAMIFFFIYLIALGDFTHVVVGSAEMAYLVMKGEASVFDYFFRFLLPTGFGNILGGTGVFTMMIYGQVNEEINGRA